MSDTPVMPEPPDHPEPQTMKWTNLELDAIKRYGADYYRLGVEAGRKERDEDTIDMALCGSRKLVLHIGQRYRFYPVGDCAMCAAMRAEHDEAYGPAQEGKHD